MRSFAEPKWRHGRFGWSVKVGMPSIAGGYTPEVLSRRWELDGYLIANSEESPLS